MQLKKLCAGLFILISVSIFAETNRIDKKKEIIFNKADSVKLGIDYLKKHIQTNTIWQSDNPEVLRTVNGLINFAEQERIDTILVKLQKFQKNGDLRYINRSPENVSDSLQVRGFQGYRTILEKMKQLDRAIWNGVDMKTIPLHENLIAGTNGKVPPIAEGDEEAIIRRSRIILPDSLKNVFAVQDSLGKAANNFDKIKNRQKARSFLLEVARQRFNAKIEKMNLDSAISAYRKYAVRVFSDSLQNQLSDSLKLRNRQILTHYNDSIVRSVNDSINLFVKTLQRYTQNDSVSINIQTLSGKPSQLWLRNNQRAISRMYIKNIQNDSIGIQLMNIDKQTIGIAIEDNITFNRIEKKQHRDYVFQKFNPDQKLTKIQKKYDIVAPWDLGGNGTLGFTQMFLSNWKAGGRSAFSFLTVLSGYANYSNDSKLKWENSVEFRNGWIRQGGDIDQTQKNDDKLELISRLGVNAFKDWYYSTEIDFKTQFFNGYNYPNDSVPISTYMSPATTFFKLGFDYKPNKNFSLFLSPITAKNVFVRDTALVDQTKYGVPAHSRSFWEPGLNIDLRYKLDVTPRISYETKYKMFLNYQQPFKKVDINWENTIVAQLTNRISMTFMLYMLYDDNVTFPTGKFGANGTEIFKPKWQTKELTTIGFSYKINKHVYQRRKIH
jgi:hypothetical protein